MEYIITLQETKGRKIYVDPQGREGIYLYPGEIKKLGLKSGTQIEEEELERIRISYALPRARHRAIGILAKRDKTEQELREKLQASLTDSQSLEETISYIQSCGYIDDLQYARDYLSSHRHRKSFLMIKTELRKKGIDSQILEEVFCEAGEQPLEDLLSQMEKYMRKFPNPDRNTWQKVYAHFAQKGYLGSLIRETINFFQSHEEDGVEER